MSFLFKIKSDDGWEDAEWDQQSKKVTGLEVDT
jgi:hypothetical protein